METVFIFLATELVVNYLSVSFLKETVSMETDLSLFETKCIVLFLFVPLLFLRKHFIYDRKPSCKQIHKFKFSRNACYNHVRNKKDLWPVLSRGCKPFRERPQRSCVR